MKILFTAITLIFYLLVIGFLINLFVKGLILIGILCTIIALLFAIVHLFFFMLSGAAKLFDGVIKSFWR